MSTERARFDLDNLNNAIRSYRVKIENAERQAEKLRIYIEVAASYGGPEPATPPKPAAATESPRHGRPPGGISTMATDAATLYITEQQAPQNTHVLLNVLRQKGIEIGGANPLGNLSGFLSRAAHLKNSRSYGWSLREWPTDWPSGKGPRRATAVNLLADDPENPASIPERDEAAAEIPAQTD